jgi:hypothetical protein
MTAKTPAVHVASTKLHHKSVLARAKKLTGIKGSANSSSLLRKGITGQSNNFELK